MKRCLTCLAEFSGPAWICPHCDSAPQSIGGVLAFAPELALENDGMAPDAHHALDQVQHRSFWFRSRSRLLVEMARRYFPETRALLEIGCGTGYVLSALAKALPHARIVGSEIYANGLDYAKRRLDSRAELFQMNAEAIPFVSEFDLIAACDVLEHVENDRHVLSEIYRALQPGGGIILTVPQHPFLWSQSDEIACHKRRYRTKELREKAREAGFTILRDTSFVTMLLPILVLQRLTKGRRKDYDTEAEFSLPRWLDHALEKPMTFDRQLIKLGIELPAGGSRMIVAIKRKDS
ncbi:class I SAM-dependent methyltransferase [Dongia soli]|uniref:Methyltransferase domain-containing protein n=1 Tax=Dongia soli TaxID=600628 RepID=A0ABU5ECH6_9PROT|nr:methyltransferase domain-containing protein [Dongia soli]MDY0884065.1 methyltransferase domain-containing protein [Dongia soli]